MGDAKYAPFVAFLRGKQTLADQLTGDDARRIARDLLK